jgi:hypothetical protein
MNSIKEMRRMRNFCVTTAFKETPHTRFRFYLRFLFSLAAFIFANNF